MPIRILSKEIEALRALNYIYTLVKYVIDKHPSIISKFEQELKENAKIQQEDNAINGL